ncbi:hypothetical protein EVAR_30850_1 [Eumeta japonica]|uniref:Uncharacterized protein n=1 Tax=Eumeta variegata TaxID=151549 RepID=A0A4C1XS24_EUMVA|nr:hypothetical protein EVAR_30850_1 [Eumeta japonica]
MENGLVVIVTAEGRVPERVALGVGYMHARKHVILRLDYVNHVCYRDVPNRHRFKDAYKAIAYRSKARLWPDHRNRPFLTLVTRSSFKPHRSLTSLFLHLSYRATPHILRSDRISTSLIQPSFFFCHIQLSLPYISERDTARAAARAVRDGGGAADTPLILKLDTQWIRPAGHRKVSDDERRLTLDAVSKQKLILSCLSPEMTTELFDAVVLVLCKICTFYDKNMNHQRLNDLSKSVQKPSAGPRCGGRAPAHEPPARALCLLDSNYVISFKLRRGTHEPL